MKLLKVTMICQGCGDHFETWVKRLKKGQGRFCSRECSGRHGHRVKANVASLARLKSDSGGTKE